MKITAEDIEKALAIQEEEHRARSGGICASYREVADLLENCNSLMWDVVEAVTVADIAGDSKLELWTGGFLRGVTLTLKAIALAEQRSKEVSDLERMIQSTD